MMIWGSRLRESTLVCSAIVVALSGCVVLAGTADPAPAPTPEEGTSLSVATTKHRRAVASAPASATAVPTAPVTTTQSTVAVSSAPSTSAAPAIPTPQRLAALRVRNGQLDTSNAPAGTKLAMRIPLTNDASVNDVLMSWAAARRSAFAGSARQVLQRRAAAAPAPAVAPPQPGPTPTTPTPAPAPAPAPAPPTLTVEKAPPEAEAVPSQVRLRITERLERGPTTSQLTLYRLPTGAVVFGSGLIAPQARPALLEEVRKRVGEAATQPGLGWAVSNWPGAIFGSVLHDLQLGRDGSLAATVPTNLLQDEPRPQVVKISPTDAAPLLSEHANALLDPASPAVTDTQPDCGDASCVALTYDDGPSRQTERVVGVLDRASVPATFFMIGNYVKKLPEVAKRVADSGHEIGNHTWSHARLNRISFEQERLQVIGAQLEIERATGRSPRLLRPPYGRYDDDTKRLGLGLALWSVDTHDWRHRDPLQTAAIAMGKASAGAVILMHDSYAAAADATALIITALRSDGYRLVSMAEMFGPPQEGALYYSSDHVEPPPVTSPPSTAPPPSPGARDR